MGRLAPPLHPNSLPLTFQLDKFYGDQVEIEHTHRLLGQAGAMRVLAYHNHENMGRFDDAVAAYQGDPTRNNATTCPGDSYGSANANAPDLCHVRKPNDKVGVGINLEQHITDDTGV